jgi:GNAT superfamily N-acetyltransferase
MELTARPGRADATPGRELLQAMLAEMRVLYGPIDVPGAPTATPDEMAPPDGAFLLVWRGEAAVACGGLKRLDAEACEIKRMFVVPDARGQGVAGVLLIALEDEARRLGYAIARLDTGPFQPHAQRMYERAGYEPIGNFNANPFASFWGEKWL